MPSLRRAAGSSHAACMPVSTRRVRGGEVLRQACAAPVVGRGVAQGPRRAAVRSGARGPGCHGVRRLGRVAGRGRGRSADAERPVAAGLRPYAPDRPGGRRAARSARTSSASRARASRPTAAWATRTPAERGRRVLSESRSTGSPQRPPGGRRHDDRSDARCRGCSIARGRVPRSARGGRRQSLTSHCCLRRVLLLHFVMLPSGSVVAGASAP